jgi:hypothetical protein
MSLVLRDMTAPQAMETFCKPHRMEKNMDQDNDHTNNNDLKHLLSSPYCIDLQT